MLFDQRIINLALDPVVNFGKVTVSTGYASGATTIILNSGDGSKLPDPLIDGSFNLVWWNWTDYPDPSDDPYVEIIRCISRTGDTLTVMRGQETTSGTNKNILGKTYKMILSPTKKTIGDIQTDAQSRVNSHAALYASVHNFDSSGDAPAQLHGIARHTGTIGTWANIDKTISNIADITTKSHTSLTGIGTNTHSQIDTHISSTASVHNFDSSGNAPPQLHGKTSHDSTTVDGGAALPLIQLPSHGSLYHTGLIGTESQITFASTGGHIHDGVYSTRVPWNNIDKTTSSIADITTRSHASLTDGIVTGTTNSHGMIDSHISTNTNVHLVGSGNYIAIASGSQYTAVNKAGDTMTGALNLPSNGLKVGTNQLAVSGGFVGIGTTSPDRTFQVVGSIETANSSGSSRKALLSNVSGSIGQIDCYDFGAAQSMPLNINPNGGKVGISNSSPGYPLDVSGDINSSTAVKVGGVALPKYADSRFKVGYFTYDVTLTTDLAITGIGFTPKVVHFSGVIDLTSAAFWGGYDNGTVHYCIADNHGQAANTYSFSSGRSIFFQISGGNARASIKSLDVDGFTLERLIGGSPTGTATVLYTAFR